MRISTANSYDTAIDQLQRRQQAMSEGQLELTTGKRINRSSDDPAAAARAERMLAAERRNEASMRAVDASRNAMVLTESALGDANDLLQQAREALVAAGNGSYSDAERRIQAQQLREIRAQLFTVANRPDGGNGFLFGGQGSAAPPFIDTPAGVSFQGLGGQGNVSAGEPLPMALDGQAIWLQARRGNGVFETRALQQNGTAAINPGTVTDPTAITGSTYEIQFTVTPGTPNSTTTYSVLRDGAPTALTNMAFKSGEAIQIDGMALTLTGAPADGDRFETRPSTTDLSVFEALDTAIAGLENGELPAQVVGFALRDVDQVMGRLQSARTSAGETLKRIDGVADRLDEHTLAVRTTRSEAEDLDMVEAISTFQAQQTGYDAALKAYSMVQRMSLFQYING
ncbi:flagellar hook-associated protein FlgL [Methylibium rhizosphaerae]|jgi:flagellar hook-associated protein 3 FlgL|uniref:flagellar hook-associated protein FlgL n=1 Tax=Methylibium rhizosphaerae TaxID=2570323 RepID=UPI00112BF521|nr:flagellar hook-associated protein FlgL [Methylibium rhizosphaerae]